MNNVEVNTKLKDNKPPVGWVKIRLGELGKFKTSSVDKKVDKNEKPVRLINYMDVYRKNFIDNSLKLMEVTANNHEIIVSQVRKGDILFTPSSETPDDIGHSAVVLEDLPNTLYSYHLVRLTIRESISIDLKFRGYFCNFKEVLRQFELSSTGVTRYTLSRKDFEEVEIILPISLTEQHKIAEILETIDETIEKTDEIFKKYKRIKQGLMHDLLTRGITAFEFEKDKLIASVKKVFKNGDHRFGREENLVSHLSRHFEDFLPEWDVDNEVEKNKERQRPDIIIHKRGTDKNLFAIEVKKNDNLNAIKEDIKKLEDVMLEDYHYEDTIFIGFDIENFEDIFKLSEKVNFILVSRNGEIKVKSRVRRFKESTLGRIPEEWKVVELGEVGKIITGSTPSTERTEYYGEDYPFISPEDINYEKYVNKSVKMLSKLGFKISRKIPPKSICVVCIGSTIGKVSLTIEETTTNQQINTIVSNRKIYDPDGLYYFTFFYIQKPLRIEAGLQAVPIVNKSKFTKIKIPIPPLPEQRYIASILSQIDETIEKEQSYKNKYERLKQGLMEDLLTGKVRVNHLIKEGVESV